MSIQLMLVVMTVPLLVLEVVILAELGLLGRISTGTVYVYLSHFLLAHPLEEVVLSGC